MCFATVPSITTDCQCGHHFAPVAREIEEVDGELVEMTAEAREQLRQQAIKQKKQDQGRAQTLDDLIKIGRQRGMRRPELWAKFVLRARHAKEARR